MLLAHLNIRLDALAEYIMVSFILSLEKRNIIAVGLLDPYRLTIAYIHGVLVHSNLAQYIAYKIFKRKLL